MSADVDAIIAAHHRCCADPEVRACEPPCDGSLCECGDVWPCDVRTVADELEVATEECGLLRDERDDARADVARLWRTLEWYSRHLPTQPPHSVRVAELLARTEHYTKDQT